MKKDNPKPFSVYMLMALILIQGLSGISGGIGLVLDPTGESLQIPISWLDDSPFDDYLVPGLILFFILGIFPLLVFYGLLRKTSWSWFASLFVGAALVIWIVVEIMIIGYQPRPPLQIIYAILGLLILAFVFLPSVRKFCQDENHNRRL
jgi:hypothetical protein